jgi:hypothetical protein
MLRQSGGIFKSNNREDRVASAQAPKAYGHVVSDFAPGNERDNRSVGGCNGSIGNPSAINTPECKNEARHIQYRRSDE